MPLGGQYSAQEHPQLRRFMWGQFGNLFKFSLWWISLAPLTYALLNSTRAVGIGRIVYNTSLCLLSPLGGIVVERFAAKKVLCTAAGVRFFIWCMLLPFVWAIRTEDWDGHWLLSYVLFNVMLCIDGAAVAGSTLLDIDMVGLDLVAGKLGVEVDDEARNWFNSRNELFFSVCFIIFCPLLAFGGLPIRHMIEKWTDWTDAMAATATLISLFFVTFMFATIVQLYFFSSLPTENTSAAEAAAAAEQTHGAIVMDSDSKASSSLSNPRGGKREEEEEDDLYADAMPSRYSDDGEAGSYPSNNKTAPGTSIQAADVEDDGEQNDDAASTCVQIRGAFGDLKDAFSILLKHPPILFRLVFLAIEIAVEDAAILVIASQCAVNLSWLGNGDVVEGNVWTAMGVSVGKLGAALASFVMMRVFKPPTTRAGFWPLFLLVAIGGLSSIGFPLAVVMRRHHGLSENGARAIFLTTFFVFFFVTTLPKIGFMSLLQSMVSNVPNGHRVFGFVAILATALDGIIIMVMTSFFETQGIEQALWSTFILLASLGFLELLGGPFLVLGVGTNSGNEGEAGESGVGDDDRLPGGDSEAGKSPRRRQLDDGDLDAFETASDSERCVVDRGGTTSNRQLQSSRSMDTFGGGRNSTQLSTPLLEDT